MRRVVITGMGIVSCLGNSLHKTVRALQQGTSGIEFLPQRKKLRFHSGLSGVLKDVGVPDVPKKNLRQMGEGSYLAVNAALQAIRDADLTEEQLHSNRTGVIIGNMGNMKDIFEQCGHVCHQTKRLGGNALQRVMASSVSANLSVLLGTRGYAMTIGSACASSAMAIGHSYQLIKYGLQDRMICGGVQEDSWESVCHFDALRAFSKREDDPKGASRPFDKYRDGLVPSSGCGIVILEAYEQTRHKLDQIYADVAGYAATSDGYDMTIPSGEGGQRCIEEALQDADLFSDDVDYINAHATSTRVGDAVEARVLAKLFGNKPYVSSTKSLTGHEIGAAGSNELIYTALMMRHGFIAPSINIEEIDEDCAGIRVAANESVDADVQVAISNSFGFGGVNTCLVLQLPCDPN